jgi:hypothetical protein
MCLEGGYSDASGSTSRSNYDFLLTLPKGSPGHLFCGDLQARRILETVCVFIVDVCTPQSVLLFHHQRMNEDTLNILIASLLLFL